MSAGPPGTCGPQSQGPQNAPKHPHSNECVLLLMEDPAWAGLNSWVSLAILEVEVGVGVMDCSAL